GRRTPVGERFTPGPEGMEHRTLLRGHTVSSTADPVMRSLLAGLAALALLSGGAPPARAGMVLTPAAQAAGFRLSTFASGFPTDRKEGNGPVGPLGVALPIGGRVLVTDAPGNIRRFPSDTDGQNAGSVAPLQFYGHNNAAGLAQVRSAIYMTQQV